MAVCTSVEVLVFESIDQTFTFRRVKNLLFAQVFKYIVIKKNCIKYNGINFDAFNIFCLVNFVIL